MKSPDEFGFRFIHETQGENRSFGWHWETLFVFPSQKERIPLDWMIELARVSIEIVGYLGNKNKGKTCLSSVTEFAFARTKKMQEFPRRRRWRMMRRFLHHAWQNQLSPTKAMTGIRCCFFFFYIWYFEYRKRKLHIRTGNLMPPLHYPKVFSNILSRRRLPIAKIDISSLRIRGWKKNQPIITYLESLNFI